MKIRKIVLILVQIPLINKIILRDLTNKIDLTQALKYQKYTIKAPRKIQSN